MQYLHNIHGHAQLKELNDGQRVILCREIRDFLVSHVAQTGGHLSSNLGVVELTVAIETVFDTASDRLVFDVGHQSYVHKLLTGRRADFDGLRQFGGIAGFPKPSESETDAFVAGHASSSVSIALGMARARTLQKQNYSVVALFGDGAATGGMIYEGLNDLADSKEPLVVILNDNAMSIDRSVGGMSSHLSKLRTKQGYLGMKRWFRTYSQNHPGSSWLYRGLRSIRNWLRRVLLPTTIFESMGIKYLGPVDGHDVNNLISVLKSAKAMRKPVLVHVITQKGRGYHYAENDPCKFHGVGSFDPATGESMASGKDTFSAAFGAELCRLAEKDNRICAITAAMPGGTGLLGFKEQFPDRLFDVGIAEEHAVSMAGGLAKQGMIPVVAIYSTFLQRAYDQILQDVGLLNLPVIFAVDRAGIVGDDGETHHGMFDVGFLRHVPGLQVLCPASTAELQNMLRWAVLNAHGPVAIRYPRGSNGEYSGCHFDPSNHAVYHNNGKHSVIVTYGTAVNRALEASNQLAESGIDCAVIRLTCLNDLSSVDLACWSHAFVLEDVYDSCGIYRELACANSSVTVFPINPGAGFVTHGSPDKLYSYYGTDVNSIVKSVKEALSNEK